MLLHNILQIVFCLWGLWMVLFLRCIFTRMYYLMPSFSPSIKLMKAKKTAQEAETCNLKHIGVYEYGKRGDAATRKAADLLWSHLNNGQKNELIRNQAFVVYTPRGKFRFGLNLSTNYATPRGPWRYACIHLYSAHDLPSPDRILALKLLAEANPDKFLRIAVISPS